MDAIAPLLFTRLEAAVNDLVRIVALLREPGAASDAPQARESESEYISVKELAGRIPYREQTIRNFLSAGEFKEGVHYYKRRGRVIFRWSQIERWLGERDAQDPAEAPFYPVHHARTRKEREAIL